MWLAACQGAQSREWRHWGKKICLHWEAAVPVLRERIRKTKVQKSRGVVLCTALCFASVPASRIQGHNSSFRVDSEYLLTKNVQSASTKGYCSLTANQEQLSLLVCFLNMKHCICAGKWLHPEVTGIVFPYVDVWRVFLYHRLQQSRSTWTSLKWADSGPESELWALWPVSKPVQILCSAAYSLEASKERNAQFISVSANEGRVDS